MMECQHLPSPSAGKTKDTIKKWPWPMMKRKRRRRRKRIEAEEDLLKLYSEHWLPPERLADLFPLARLNPTNLMASQGISQEEARLRLADPHQQNHHRHTGPGTPRIAIPQFLLRFLRLLRPPSIFIPDLHNSFRLLLSLSALLTFGHFVSSPSESANSFWLFLLQFIFLLFANSIAIWENWQSRKRTKEFTRWPNLDEANSSAATMFTAIRQGQEVKLSQREILPGELLVLRAGQRIPGADIRILKIMDGPFRAECPWLRPTKESMELTEEIAPKHLDAVHGRNILFAGSICTNGTALGLAIKAGKQTLLSRLLAIEEVPMPTSPKEEEQQRQPQSQKNNSLTEDYHRLLGLCLCLSFGLSAFSFLLTQFLLPSFNLDDPFWPFVNVFLPLLIALLPQSVPPLAWTGQLLLIGHWMRRKCGGILLRRPTDADTLGQTQILMTHNPALFSAVNCPILTDVWLASSNRHISVEEIVDWAVRKRQTQAQGPIGPKEFGKKWGQKTMELLKATAAIYHGNDAGRTMGNGTKNGKTSNGNGGGEGNGIPCGHLKYSNGELLMNPPNEETNDPHPFVDLAMNKFFGQTMPAESLREGMEILQIGRADAVEWGLPVPASPSLAHWQIPRMAIVRGAGEEFGNEEDEEENGEEGGLCQLIAGGAPEELLKICTKIRAEGNDEEEEKGEEEGGEYCHPHLLPLTDDHLLQFEQKFLQFSAQSKRCFALAILDLSSSSSPFGNDDLAASSVAESAVSPSPSPRSHSSTSALSSSSSSTAELPHADWCFLGLLAFSEPSKAAECDGQLRELEAEGIRLMMISDDHPALVQAVGKKCGLIKRRGNNEKMKDIENGKENDNGKEEKMKKKKTHNWMMRRQLVSPLGNIIRRQHHLTKSHSNTSSGYQSSAEHGKLEKNWQKGGWVEEDNEEEEEGWPIDGESLAQIMEDGPNGGGLAKLLNGQMASSSPARHLLFSRLESVQIVDLIKHFQSTGHSVTFVAQNGIADAPALGQANFGLIASGTHYFPPSECSSPLHFAPSSNHSTADALCSSPQFGLAHLVEAIRLGKSIRPNLASIFRFCLSHCLALFLPFLLAPFFGFPFGLSSIQILLISLLFSLPPSISLIFRRHLPASTSSSTSSLSSSSLFLSSLLLPGSLIALGSLLAFLSVFWLSGLAIVDLAWTVDTFWQWDSPNMTIPSNGLLLTAEQQIGLVDQASAAWQITLVGAQQFHLWLCAANGASLSQSGNLSIFSNLSIWLAIFVDLLLLLVVIYLLPFGFIPGAGIHPPPVFIWLFPICVGICLFVLDSLHKLANTHRWKQQEKPKI